MIYPKLKFQLIQKFPGKEKLPLLVYLSPRTDGSLPASLSAQLEKEENAAVVAAVSFPEGLVYEGMPFEIWDVIEDALAQTGADPERVSVAGEGFGVFEFAIHYAPFLSAAVPLAGGGMAWCADQIGSLPVWAFHGSDDTVVPKIHSQEMIDHLIPFGGAHITLIQGFGHEIEEEVFSDPAVLTFLLSMRRAGTPGMPKRRENWELTHYLTVPKDFDPKKESLPLIVFLHGAGERGTDLTKVKVHGVPKFFVPDPDYKGLRVITLSPQCPDNIVWNNLPLEVMALIRRIASETNADPKRISLTGLSMGGYGSWELGAISPETFCALGPVCGSGNPAYADRYTMPVYAYHGDRDGVVTPWRSRVMVDAITEKGGDARLVLCEGVDHGSWVNAYDLGDMIDWLAAQSR